MPSRTSSVVRSVIMVMVVLAAAVGFYVFRSTQGSERVLAEMLAVADDMDLSPAWTDEVKRLIREAHDDAFARAMDTTQARGRKFDDKLYFEEVIGFVVARARESGNEDLAVTIERQSPFFSLQVTER